MLRCPSIESKTLIAILNERSYYHSLTSLSPLSLTEGLPQYLPVTPLTSLKPSLIGIFAPSARLCTVISGRTAQRLSMGLQRTRGLRRSAHQATHVCLHPTSEESGVSIAVSGAGSLEDCLPRAAGIDDQSRIFPSKDSGHCVLGRFANSIRLRFPAISSFCAIVRCFLYSHKRVPNKSLPPHKDYLVLVHHLLEVSQSHCGASEAVLYLSTVTAQR